MRIININIFFFFLLYHYWSYFSLTRITFLYYTIRVPRAMSKLMLMPRGSKAKLGNKKPVKEHVCKRNLLKKISEFETCKLSSTNVLNEKKNRWRDVPKYFFYLKYMTFAPMLNVPLLPLLNVLFSEKRKKPEDLDSWTGTLPGGSV